MNTDLQPGHTFANRYVIGHILGDGGYGRVFEAQDHEVGRRVALKVLRPDQADGSYSHEKRERFRREAATVANLQDPHTVTLFDHGETPEGLLYMVFEFVNGTPLNELIRRGPLRSDIASRIVRQVLQSLREAHAAGILHRDIKPENIIVHDYGDEQYRAKLVDFGLAKSTLPTGEVPLTASGLVMGTAAYVSPEAYRLEQLSPASDLFGLGLVFYEMVVGQAAIQAASAMEIATEMVAPNEFMVPDFVPEPTRSIITQLIRKNPEERYQSASDVLAHLPESTLDSPFAASGGLAAPGGYDQGANGSYGYGGGGQYATPGYGQQAQYSGGYDPYMSGGYAQPQGGGYDPTRPPTLIEGQSPNPYGGQPNTMVQDNIQQQQQHLGTYDQQGYDPSGAYDPNASYAAPGGYDPYGYDPNAGYDQGYDPNAAYAQAPAAKQGGSVAGFTIALVAVLIAVSIIFVFMTGIKLPFMAANPSAMEPKVFDLTSTDTTFLWVDWKQGILIAHDPGQIPAAGRCALILDSLSDPTDEGAYYVINALEPVDARVTAYAVGPEELKLIAENCYAAAHIADSVLDRSMILASETKIRDVSRRNEKRKQRRRRARAMDGDASGGAPDLSSFMKGGGSGGGMGIFQQFLK